MRLSSLDGVRGLAVLIVFLSHTSGRDMALAPWLAFQGFGQVGVYLFFVLSGFLLARNLVDGQDVRAFYIRRFFRIAPLYFAVLLGVYAYQALGHYSPKYLHISGGAEGLLLHLLFLKGDGVFWTIAAEFMFYVVLPFVVWAGLRWGVGWLAALSVVYFVWFYAVQVFKAGLPEPRFVDINHAGQYLDVFLCGVMAGMFSWRIRDGVAAVVLALTLLATFVCISHNFLGFNQPYYDLRWLSLGYGVAFAAVTVSVANGNRILGPIFENPVLRFMGVVGFGWYLLHFAVFQVVNATGIESPVVRFALATAGTAAASWLAYVAIEKPAIALGRRLSRTPAAIPA